MAFTKINAAGIGTTETVTVDGLTVINDGSFGGNLTVSGVLTYEDVTNVDSVGLITARNGIVVGSGITLSKDGDGFFTGVTTSTTFVGNLTGNVTGNINGDLTGTLQTAAQANVTSLGTLTGLTVNGDASFTGASYNMIWDKSDNSLVVNDDARIKFGTGKDLHIYHNQSNSVIREEGTGNLNLQTTGGNVEVLTNTTETSAKFISDGAVELYYDNSKKFNTNSEGVSIHGNLALNAADNYKIYLGAGNDLEIFHNGSNGYIKNATGQLLYRSGTHTFENAAGSTEYVRIDSSGRLLIGTSSNTFTSVGSSRLQVSGTGADTAGINLVRTSSDGGGAYLQFTKNRGSATQSGDTCGAIAWMGHDGTDVESYLAQIVVKAGATATSNSMTGDITFETSNGSSVPSERMRLDSSGNFGIGNRTSSPDNLLHVHTSSGDAVIHVEAAADPKLRLRAHSGQSIIQFADAASSNTGEIVYDHASDYLKFQVAASERMRITSSGYVTKPNHPSFRAGRGSSSLNVTTGDAIIFNTTSGDGRFNNGNHYSTTTGKFTAPVAGIYSFFTHVIYQDLSDGDSMIDVFHMYINSAKAGYSHKRGYYKNGYTGDGGYYTDTGDLTAVTLAAGDEVWVQQQTGSRTVHANANYCTFSGFLIG